jgi:hypothetical protein
MSYQNLTKFDGSMYGRDSYGGLEYDWEVPNNLIIGSPGGVSSQHHHYTKGFYGKGNTSSDIYGGQGERYISGEYGNLYSEGESSSQGMGYYGDAPDYPFYNTDAPIENDYTPLTDVKGNDTDTYKENGVEYINTGRENFAYSPTNFSTTNVLTKLGTIIILGVLFICGMFYFLTLQKFLQSKFGPDLNLKIYLIGSLLLTALLLVIHLFVCDIRSITLNKKEN